MAYRRPAETKKDRVNQAIANYAARDSNNAPIIRNDPQPVSGRRLVWYGWKMQEELVFFLMVLVK